MNARISDFVLGSVDHPKREHHETWLYYHLKRAAASRVEMESAPCFGDYADAEIALCSALARASEHYRALLRMGPAIEPLLAQMAMTEGLTP